MLKKEIDKYEEEQIGEAAGAAEKQRQTPNQTVCVNVVDRCLEHILEGATLGNTDPDPEHQAGGLGSRCQTRRCWHSPSSPGRKQEERR